MMRGLRGSFGLSKGDGASARTRRELLTTLARVALWLAVAVVLIRGLGGVLGGGHSASRPPASGGGRASAWPDDAARALAVQFATAYLTHVPGEDPVVVARGLVGMASPGLAAELAPRFPRRAARQAVRSATIAGAVGVDRGHALVTVAATVATGNVVRSWRVTVPVARDDGGGLVVDDLPSFAPAPARAQAGPPETEPLLGAERAQIEDVVGRFLRAYLAGDPGGLRYLAVPGARIPAASARLELLSLASVESAGHAAQGGRLVLASVHARDRVSRVAYWLRYRVRLVRRDRWYVVDLNGPRMGGGSR